MRKINFRGATRSQSQICKVTKNRPSPIDLFGICKQILGYFKMISYKNKFLILPGQGKSRIEASTEIAQNNYLSS